MKANYSSLTKTSINNLFIRVLLSFMAIFLLINTDIFAKTYTKNPEIRVHNMINGVITE